MRKFSTLDARTMLMDTKLKMLEPSPSQHQIQRNLAPFNMIAFSIMLLKELRSSRKQIKDSLSTIRMENKNAHAQENDRCIMKFIILLFILPYFLYSHIF